MADFVDKIVKDPKNPPATMMLSGYLGASSEPDYTRLYFDPHLSNYVDIPNADILHQQDAKSDDGLQASHVWIARNAQLIHGAPAADKPKGTFLEGAIMRDHIAAAAGGGAGGGQAVWPLTMDPVQCPHTFVACHQAQFSPTAMAQMAIPTVLAGGLCHSFGCHPTGHHTVMQQAAIPTVLVGGLCPSFACHPTGHHTVMQQAAIPTVLAGGLCHSFGCHPTGHHTVMQQAAIPTVLAGGLCHTFGCHPTGHPTMMQQMAIPTLLPGGLCPTFAVHCGGGGGQHTMMQFMPNNPGQSTWYACPPR